MTAIPNMQSPSPADFKAGDGATYHIGSDSYPMTIRKRSGRVLWATRDICRRGLYLVADVPRSRWERFSLRKNGQWRPTRSGCGYLSVGRSCEMDPSF